MRMKTQTLRWAVLLVGATLIYNIFEGVISVVSGLRAHSLTLVAFGIDSYIEVLAAGAVLWRLSYKDEEEGERAEGQATRLIGATFLILAAGVVFEAITSLAQGRGAERSIIGILVLGLSLTLMPLLSLAKLWVAAQTKLPVLAAEAKETVACSYLSLSTFIGLVVIALAGWWWIDSAAALLMVPWLVKEGLEGLKMKNCYEGLSPCFCRACLFGLKSCPADCCVVAA